MVRRIVRSKALASIATAYCASALHFGCSVSSAESASDEAPSSGGTTTPGTDTDAAVTLTFDPARVNAPALAQTTVSVRVSPAGSRTVALSLIGESRDASLEAAQLITDEFGVASFVLNASSTATTFSVRASVGRNATVELPVTISEAMLGAMDVSVKYGGIRQVKSYVVAVYPDLACSSNKLNAGFATRIVVTTPTLPTRVEGTPMGRALAVVVDGDAKVRGCTSVRAESMAQNQSVEVVLEDLPVDLRAATLDLSITTVEGANGLKATTASAIPVMVSAFSDGEHDIVALLQAMETSATGSLQPEFASLRVSSRWDAFAVEAYAPLGGADLLRSQLQLWLQTGLDSLETQPMLRTRLELETTNYSSPELLLLGMARIDNAANELVASGSLALDLDANDRMNWSSTLSWTKAALLDRLAHDAAAPEFPNALGVSAQLADAFDCGRFASELDVRAVWTNSNARVCTQTCLATLCRVALSSMYDRAKAAVSLAYATPTTLLINASGSLLVDETAKPTGSTGTWVGALSEGATRLLLSGTYENR